MSLMTLARNPFSDAIFVFEGIDWLRWLVASFFFLLGLFAGWWTWRYRRKLAQPEGAEPAEERQKGKPVLKLHAKDSDVDLAGTVPSDFGPIYKQQPEDKDDLQKINGIGKALRAKLYSLGIYKFEQIANWGESEIAAVSKKLHTGGQIESDGWVKQAEAFAAGD